MADKITRVRESARVFIEKLIGKFVVWECPLCGAEFSSKRAVRAHISGSTDGVHSGVDPWELSDGIDWSVVVVRVILDKLRF